LFSDDLDEVAARLDLLIERAQTTTSDL